MRVVTCFGGGPLGNRLPDLFCRIPKLRPCSSLRVSKRGPCSWDSVRCACSCHHGDFPCWTQGCAPLFRLRTRGSRAKWSIICMFISGSISYSARPAQTGGANPQAQSSFDMRVAVIQSCQPLGVVLDESGAHERRGLQKITFSFLHGNLSFEA